MTGPTGLKAPRQRQAPGADPMKPRPVKMTDTEWEAIKDLAAAEGCSAGALVRRVMDEYATSKRKRRKAS